MARTPLADSDSQYAMDSEFDSEEYGSDGESEVEQPTNLSRRASLYSSASTSDSNDSYLEAATSAMGTLQTLHSSPSSNWKRALTHRSGTVVSVTKDKSYAGGARKGKGGEGGHFANVFKGELEIKGFGPASVFGVVGTRKLWDEWYNEGNLVENLNDTTSLTYMSMKGILGSTTRDLSLVERVAGSATGTILFVSTSVVTPKVPRVSGRVRAAIALNGWVLEPIANGGTKVTYYLHVNVKTFIPSFAAGKYLARRPTCIAKIAEYLQAHGSPPMATMESAPPTVPNPARRRRDSTASKRSSRSRAESTTSTSAGGGGALPIQVGPNTEAESYPDLAKGQKLFKSLLALPDQEWSHAVDPKGNKILMRKRDGGLLDVVKGESFLEGVTTEQVLGSILSATARKEWDPRFQSTAVVGLDNGIDQGTHVESHKAMFPSLGARHYLVARGVEREDPTTDNGQILVVTRSSKLDINSPKNSTKAQMDLIGWLIEAHSDRSVKITSICQIDVKEQLKSFIGKILISEMAAGPRNVVSFIDDFGYMPFFVRWGNGPAQLISDSESNLTKGEVIFKVNGEGTGTMANGQQKCWLQYSEKMFERGIELKVLPSDSCTISKVDGLPRTLEFSWTEEVKVEGAKIILSKARGDGAEDIYLDGKFLDRTVGMEVAVNGSGAGMSRKRAPKKEIVAAVVPVAAVASVMARNQSNGSEIKAPTSNGLVNGSSSTRSVQPTVVAPVQQSTTTTTVVSGSKGVPSDACIIISDDLYFTKSQVKLIGGVVAAAYLYGKFM